MVQRCLPDRGQTSGTLSPRRQSTPPPTRGGTSLTPPTYWREGGLHQPLIEDRRAVLSGLALGAVPGVGGVVRGKGLCMRFPPPYGSSLLHSMKAGTPHRPSHSDLRSPCFRRQPLPPYLGGDSTHSSHMLARGGSPPALIEDRSGGPLRPRPWGGTGGGWGCAMQSLGSACAFPPPLGSSLLHSLKVGAPPRLSHSFNGTSSSHPEGAPIANTMSEFARVRARHKA